MSEYLSEGAPVSKKAERFLLVWILQLLAAARSENTRLRDEIAQFVIAGGRDHADR